MTYYTRPLLLNPRHDKFMVAKAYARKTVSTERKAATRYLQRGNLPPARRQPATRNAATKKGPHETVPGATIRFRAKLGELGNPGGELGLGELGNLDGELGVGFLELR